VNQLLQIAVNVLSLRLRRLKPYVLLARSGFYV
jgi:hypothetical protein